MPTYAQLEQEAAWRAEVVPDAIKWFIGEVIAFWKLSPGAVGCKGNNLHLRGAHRSRRWIKTSRYCTNRTYTASHPDDLAGDEDWLVGIDLTLPRSVLLAVCKRLDAAVRAGLIEEVSEWYGNTNGDDRVDGYNNIENRVATSDDSHLWHLHITLKRRFANTLAVLQRLFSILTGDDMGDLDYTPRERPKAVGDRAAATLLADVWGQEQSGKSPVDSAPSFRTRQLISIETKLDKLLAAPEQPAPIVTDEQLERVLRKVLGGVDGASPPAQG
jgi:hypothetical protein